MEESSLVPITVFIQSKRKFNGPIFAKTCLKFTHEAITLCSVGAKGGFVPMCINNSGLITCIQELFKYLISFLKLLTCVKILITSGKLRAEDLELFKKCLGNRILSWTNRLFEGIVVVVVVVVALVCPQHSMEVNWV